MPRITFGRMPRIATLLVAGAVSLAIAAGASADTSPGRGPGGPTATPPANDCAVLRVQLNGTQPATQTCLATAQPGQGTGRVGSGGCFTGDFELYSDSGFGGKRLCLWGYGTANLRDYDFGWWRSWEDKTSSFKSGYYCGYLYHDGPPYYQGQYYFTYTQYFSSMPSSWWNDSVSAVFIRQCVS
jgi:hypothetical protein